MGAEKAWGGRGVVEFGASLYLYLKETACRDVFAWRCRPMAFPWASFDRVNPSFGVLRRVFALPTRKTRTVLAAYSAHRHG
jgi:hypothetical protein